VPVSIADVQDAIADGIKTLGTTASPLAVTWADEPRPAGKVLLILNLVQIGAIQDRICHVPGVDPGTFVSKLSTLFYLRVQVRAESVYNHPASDALFATEKVRAGLRNPPTGFVWGAGIRNQADENTYVHHISYPDKGRTISAYAFETGFRAVVDHPLEGVIDSGPNMTSVITEDADGAAEVDIGEDEPQELAITVARP
jgi:hypothetical protein